jgi:mRNA-degrading endonuclease toxin of MazEF toxin-antitoxin module
MRCSAMNLGFEILCDQIKTLDWRARRATRLGSVSDAVLQEVTARILALVDPEE